MALLRRGRASSRARTPRSPASTAPRRTMCGSSGPTTAPARSSCTGMAMPGNAAPRRCTAICGGCMPSMGARSSWRARTRTSCATRAAPSNACPRPASANTSCSGFGRPDRRMLMPSDRSLVEMDSFGITTVRAGKSCPCRAVCPETSIETYRHFSKCGAHRPIASGSWEAGASCYGATRARGFRSSRAGSTRRCSRCTRPEIACSSWEATTRV
jgi:hypothetical protein